MSTPKKRGSTGSADVIGMGISVTRSSIIFLFAIPSHAPESSTISEALAGQQSYASSGVSPDGLTTRYKSLNRGTV